MRKIAIVGPESSGKTTLAQALAQHYGAPWVPDPSRSWLERHGPHYIEGDLVRIARYQVEVEQQAVRSAGKAKVIFIDTDLLNYRIWSLEKFGRVDPEIDWLIRITYYDHRLLCRPDIPWQPDPLRENPHDRERLFGVWEMELKAHDMKYMIIEGSHEYRTRKVLDDLEAM